MITKRQLVCVAAFALAGCISAEDCRKACAPRQIDHWDQNTCICDLTCPAEPTLSVDHRPLVVKPSDVKRCWIWEKMPGMEDAHQGVVHSFELCLEPDAGVKP